jgi:hypothetical protein
MGNEHPWSAPASAATVGPVELRLPAKRDKAILAQKTILLQYVIIDSLGKRCNFNKTSKLFMPIFINKLWSLICSRM